MWNRVVAAFIVFLGVNFLLENFGLPSVEIGDVSKLWPLALIWVGWRMWHNDARRRGRGDPA